MKSNASLTTCERSAMEMKPQVTIRFVEREDTVSIQEYASDAKLAATCNVPHPYPDGGAELFVEGALRDREAEIRYVFAILDGGCFCGVMALNSVDRANGRAALDYWVAVPFWNRGVATAAAGQVIQFALRTLGVTELESFCLARNPASARVLEKNRFVEVGERLLAGGKFSSERVRLFKLAPQGGSAP
jgi:[ribosomal protein S5]-alanine N-acetyltransferase